MCCGKEPFVGHVVKCGGAKRNIAHAPVNIVGAPAFVTSVRSVVMSSSEQVSNERFQIHYVRGWDKWIVVDLKFNRDNEVRDWRKKGVSGKMPIWKSSVKQDAENLAALLNKAQGDDNSLVKKAERGQSEWTPWQNKPKRATAPVTVVQFKKCDCGTRYRGDKHCD